MSERGRAIKTDRQRKKTEIEKNRKIEGKEERRKVKKGIMEKNKRMEIAHIMAVILCIYGL